jgi:hypothetical protein
VIQNAFLSQGKGNSTRVSVDKETSCGHCNFQISSFFCAESLDLVFEIFLDADIEIADYMWNQMILHSPQQDIRVVRRKQKVFELCRESGIIDGKEC